MRQGEPASSSMIPPSAGFIPAALSRLRASAWPLAMALLVAVTSLAVAAYASAWLVPPYLVLMAVVLGVPTGRPVPRHESTVASVDDAQGPPDDNVGPDSESEFEPVSSSDPWASSDAQADAEAALSSEPTAVKTKRGKGRGRKSKSVAPAVVEPTAVSWVRIGPGKFVRADTFAPTSDAPGLAGGQDPAEPETSGDDSPSLRNPEPEAAAPSAPAPASVPQTVLAWSIAWDDEYEPATALEPVAGDAEGDGLDWIEGSSLGLGLSAAFAPGVFEAETTEDNGIAPDAFARPDSYVSDDGLDSPDLETTPFHDQPPEPSAEPAGPGFEPPVACASLPSQEALSNTFASPEPVGVVSADAATGPVFRAVAVLSRARTRRRLAALAPSRAACSRRATFVAGNVRRGRSVRVSGSRLHSRRVRNAGRFRQVDRTHPPRSPPAGKSGPCA